jgi:hypothetical protein
MCFRGNAAPDSKVLDWKAYNAWQSVHEDHQARHGVEIVPSTKTDGEELDVGFRGLPGILPARLDPDDCCVDAVVAEGDPPIVEPKTQDSAASVETMLFPPE